MCNFGGRSFKPFRNHRGGPPEGLPVAGNKTKPGLNRVKVIFHEEIKVAKRFRRTKIEEGRKSEGFLVILPFSSSEKRL